MITRRRKGWLVILFFNYFRMWWPRRSLPPLNTSRPSFVGRWRTCIRVRTRVLTTMIFWLRALISLISSRTWLCSTSGNECRMQLPVWVSNLVGPWLALVTFSLAFSSLFNLFSPSDYSRLYWQWTWWSSIITSLNPLFSGPFTSSHYRFTQVSYHLLANDINIKYHRKRPGPGLNAFFEHGSCQCYKCHWHQLEHWAENFKMDASQSQLNNLKKELKKVITEWLPKPHNRETQDHYY